MPGPTAALDVSVVIPAYNAMPYVTATMDSVLRQTIGHAHMEVIAIDDGSTDGTGAELDHYAARHPELITVIHQAGSGAPGAPRNRGLELASGRYVFFLDADDYLGDEALARMVAMADEHGTDIVVGKLAGVNGRVPAHSMFARTLPRTDIFSAPLLCRTMTPYKLFRRALLDKHRIRFPTQYRTGEDLFFTGTAYVLADGISVLSDYPCVYVVKRADGQNISSTSPGMGWRVQRQLRLAELWTELVPDTAHRAVLHERNHTVELRNLCTQLTKQQYRHERDRAFAMMRELVDATWSPELSSRLPALARLRAHLVSMGHLDELIALMEVHPNDRSPAPSVVIDSGRAYATYPYFRDGRLQIPDAVYDVTDRIAGGQVLEHADLTGRLLTLSGSAGLRDVAMAADRMQLLLCRAKPPAKVRIPVERKRHTGPVGSAGAVSPVGSAGAVGSGSVGFADYHVELLLDTLDAGKWEAFIELDYNGLIEPVQIRRRATDAPAGVGVAIPGARLTDLPRPRVVRTRWTKRQQLRLTVEPLDDLGPVVSLEPPVVTGTDRASMVHLIGRFPPGQIAPPVEMAYRLRCVGSGVSRTIPVEIDAERGSLNGVIDVAELPGGTWSAELVFGVGDTALTAAVPGPECTTLVRWRRGAVSWPRSARIEASADNRMELRTGMAHPFRRLIHWIRRLRRQHR